MRPSSSMISARTSRLVRSRTPRMYWIFSASRAAMVSTLIMPRSATMHAWRIPKRSRSRLTTGNSSVTSAVLPGIRPFDKLRRGDRPVGVIEHDAEHDLLQMSTVVFGMAILAETFTTGAFEPQCRGVEKRDRNGTEQRLAVAIERLFDRLRGAAARRIDLAEPGHRLIGVVEIEPLGARHAHPAAPVIGMAVGTRDHQPVRKSLLF